MRTSGIAYINSRGVIQLHQNVIESQTIFDGSIFFGIYYPRSKDQPNSINKTDFMFTPIPYTHWKCSGRLIMKLTKQSEAMPIITDFLKTQGVSILQSVSNRSAHRYSTWDIHISFDHLLETELQYISDKSYYQETFTEIQRLSKLLIDQFGNDILWYDEKDIDLEKALISRVNTALHYFHNITEEKKRTGQDADSQTLYNPFTLRYSKGNIVSNSGKKIASILSIAEQSKNVDRHLPTIAFIESDSHYLNYRIRIIPRDRLTLFYKLSIFYSRNGVVSSTTRGLLNLIINELGNGIKVWMSYNQLYECRENYGSGKISLFIETPKRFSDQNTFMHEVKMTVARLNEEVKPIDLKHIKLWSKISPIYPNYVRKHFKKQREQLKKRRKDVFISYSSKDNEFAERIRIKLEEYGLSVFKADKENIPGDLFNEKIRSGLNQCREVCLLYSKNSLNSSYVTTEWGAAWFMNKKIITMYLDMTEEEALQSDQRLSQTQMVRFDSEKLLDYCESVLQRRLEYYIETDKYEYYT